MKNKHRIKWHHRGAFLRSLPLALTAAGLASVSAANAQAVAFAPGGPVGAGAFPAGLEPASAMSPGAISAGPLTSPDSILAPMGSGRMGLPPEANPLAGPAINLPNHGRELLAQVSNPSSGQSQFDLSPVRLPERGAAFGTFQNFRTSALYRLPSKMFMYVNTENTLRLETNVLQTATRNHADMIYRVLPNITLGYAPTRTSRISANYFFFRDQYTYNSNFLSRNIHSIGLRGDKDFLITPRTTLTTSLFWRELFITRSDELNDLIPSLTLVHRVGERGAVYSSVLNQFRWRNVFGRFQEADQFYSIGGVYRLPKWSFLFDTTLITSFGRGNLRGGVNNNQTIIMTLEAGRRLSQRLPLTAFVRAEPIFNIGQEKRAGFAGVNFRIFGGLRAEVSKPAIFPIKIGGG